MTTQRFTQTLRRQAGYTIDQTILIVAVIAILVTMIIGSVGWDLLTRAGGTKMQSHLVQFENAAGSFFSQYGLWPQDVTDGTPTANFNVLITPDAASDPDFTPGDRFRNYLPAYSVAAADETAQHPFGSGGDVTLTTGPMPGGGQDFIIFVLEDIPADEYKRAEEGIDGDFNPTDPYHSTGRLQAVENPEEARTVTMQYYANAIN